MSGTPDKKTGGTRNYAKYPKTLQNRRDEYDKFMATGKYNEELSFFDESGGYVLVNKEHNKIKKDSPEMKTTEDLARKGYKIRLESEKSIRYKDKKFDGFIYDSPMDIKTVSTAGNFTIKGALEKASRQGANTVIIRQGSSEITRKYIDDQIDLFKKESPRRAVRKIKRVIVVGGNGHVHVHDLQ
jgi:hypothetical protein